MSSNEYKREKKNRNFIIIEISLPMMLYHDEQRISILRYYLDVLLALGSLIIALTISSASISTKSVLCW